MPMQMPCATELKERLTQAKNPDVKIPMLGKLGRKPSEEAKKEDDQNRWVIIYFCVYFYRD